MNVHTTAHNTWYSIKHRTVLNSTGQTFHLHLLLPECIQINVPFDTYTILSMQSIALVLTTKNNQTKHHIGLHPGHKRETERTALANKN